MSTSFSGGCLEHLSTVQVVSLGMAGTAGELSPDRRRYGEDWCWMLGQLVSSGIWTWIVHYKLFGMFGAVTSCVRMSECTMNSRLFRWRFLSEPGVELPKWIESLWLLFSERTGGEGKWWISFRYERVNGFESGETWKGAGRETADSKCRN